MKTLLGAALFAALFFALPALAQTSAAPPVKCRVAEINPVTNHAHCIDPIGAPLDVAAEKPCQGMHHVGSGAWTMTNGCDTTPNPPPN